MPPNSQLSAGSPLEVTQVVAGLREEAGGPSYSVPALAAALRRGGVDARLRCVDGPGSAASAIGGAPLSVHAARSDFLGRRLRVSHDLARALRSDAQAGVILHTHGLWLMPNVYPAWAKRRAHGQAALVHSPRGMLGGAALSISAWRKRAFWLLAQRSALLAADCLHATAHSELEEIRQAGWKGPVAVIPNGIDLPDLEKTPRQNASDNIVLSLGRIHPKKGLDGLVRAWVGVQHEFPSWQLRIVGPAELRHDEELRGLARSLGAMHVTVEGPRYGDAKQALLRSADVFVLPTLNENFALTVAEALAAETPVISTKGAPWAGLEGEGCGWWIDHGVEPLARALRLAMRTTREERLAMGARGRLWMARDFGWDRIAADMRDLYRWLRCGGEPPATVRLT